MEAYTIRGLTFAYPNCQTPALYGLDLEIKQGEFLLLCGPSGSGKSTFLRLLKPALAPHGRQVGEILFQNRPLAALSLRDQAQRIGFVQQSPEHQLVTDKVWHELAFGLESLGLDSSVIRRRVAETASLFGIESWFHRPVSVLSGGQKQLLNLAAVVVMNPDVILLDEPTSQLDPIAAGELLSAVTRLNRDLGTTVVLTEHRLEEVLPQADRVAVLDGGRLVCLGRPREVGTQLKQSGHTMFSAMPTPMRVWAATENPFPCPLTVGQGRRWLAELAALRPLAPLSPPQPPNQPVRTVLEGCALWFRYEQRGDEVIRDLTFQVGAGEFLALLGGNGAGKTTALRLMAGLDTPQRGMVHRGGTTAFLPQDPQTLFLTSTVERDLLAAAGRGLSQEERARRIAEIAALCRLEGMLDRHPYDLSGGEQQRLALGMVLLQKPRILLLDEPTKGLDSGFKRVLADIFQQLLRTGIAIVMASHDIEFCACYAHRCALLFDGGIAAQDAPRRFFAGNRFYTTAANRMASGQLPHAITAQDVICACGGIPPVVPPSASPPVPPEQPAPVPDDHPLPLARRPVGRGRVTAAIVLLLVPFTLYFGPALLGERGFYLTALLVLMECMLPFFLVFEGRKPQPRELAVLSVLCAVAVAGRGLFFMLPQFKPVLAIVIVAGVALGSEAGFFVGAITMLVSNMMFSQGPWMPWQMFAMGLTGFLAGLVFHRAGLSRGRAALCLFGMLAAVIVYGGIMNPASALISLRVITPELALVYYLAGLPLDLAQGMATCVFLWFAGEPMLEKLERVRVKYGLLD